jgi:NAD(P)-dependent dehydrogenase (short-subunit alcohol dehydrogenase family)
MRSRSLMLIQALVALLAGCGSPGSSVSVSTVPPESRCRSYFGAGVAVAMCSNKIAQGAAPLTIALHQGPPRSGSAPGIAQAMGNPLRDGERFEIVPVDLDDLRFESQRALGPLPSFRPFVGYGRTKNMNTMFVYAPARRLEGMPITVNGAHPGIIDGTGLGRDTRGTLRIFGRLQALIPFSSTPGPSVGADTPTWLATSAEVKGVSGRFFFERKEVETAPHTTDVARCDRLWDASAHLVGLSPAL